MNDIDSGGYAFPTPIAVGPSDGIELSDEYEGGGMSLRDYFAAKAMGAWLLSRGGAESVDESDIARWSYKQADAMIAARAKEQS